MRVTPKQKSVKQCVSKLIAFRTVDCDICGSSMWMEFYYRIYHKERLSLPIARYCNTCCNSKEEAYDLAFAEKITAQDLVLHNQVKMSDFRRREVEDKLQVALSVFDEIVAEAVNGTEEFSSETPLAMFAVTKIEGALNKIRA